MSERVDNTKVAAWGLQEVEPRSGSEPTTQDTRQVRVFYGIDEPSQNSFVTTKTFARNNHDDSNTNMNATTIAGLTTNANTMATPAAAAAAATVTGTTSSGSGISTFGVGYHAKKLPKRAFSSFDNTYIKPRARARARHQPATLPSALFARAHVAAAVAAATTTTTTSSSENTTTPFDSGGGGSSGIGSAGDPRADSLLHRARRVLSLPTTAIRRNPFRTPSAPPSPSPSGSDGTTTSTSATASASVSAASKQRSLPRPNFSRSHTGHISRAKDERILELEDELREQKLKNDAAVRRIESLERQLKLKTEAIPALETILRKAIDQFHHKEAALTASLARAFDAQTNDKRSFRELVALEGDADRIAVADMSPPTSNSNSNSGSVTLRS